MDLKSGKKLLSLVYKIFMEGSRNPSQIPYTPAKTESYLGKATHSPFPRVAPESVGISSERLSRLLDALESGKATNVNTCLIVVDGKTCLDASAAPYRSDIWHITYSMAKSVTALGVGLAVDEGKLSPDKRLCELFPEYGGFFAGKIKKVTVRHLLTMAVSVGFNETGVLIEENWLRGFMEAPIREDVGECFAYNSMSSYVLSVIVQKLVGKTLWEYLDEKLFQPMDIRHTLWEKSPDGASKGGFGLYMTPIDMAKLGVLILNEGVYGGKRLISREWIREMTSVHNRPDKKFGSYDYGYQVWIDKERDIVLFNGMLGQDLLIMPKTNTVAVLTAGNSELFQHSEMLSIMEDCLCREDFRNKTPLPTRKKAYKALLEREKHFGETRALTSLLPKKSLLQRLWLRLRGKPIFPLPEEARSLIGRHCDLSENNVGLLPLFTCILQNNFSAGIRSLSFLAEGNDLVLDVEEGAFHHRLPIGFYEPRVTEIDEHGEKFLVSLSGEFAENEDGTPLLKLALGYPELAGERRLKLYYTDENAVTLTVEETPGFSIAEPFIDKLTTAASGIAALLLSFIPIGILKERVRNGFSPTLRGFWRNGDLPLLTAPEKATDM